MENAKCCQPCTHRARADLTLDATPQLHRWTCPKRSELQARAMALGTSAMYLPKMPRKREAAQPAADRRPKPPCALAMLPPDTPPVVVVVDSQEARRGGIAWPLACSHRGLVRTLKSVMEALCATNDGTLVRHTSRPALQIRNPMDGVPQLLFCKCNIFEFLGPCWSPIDFHSLEGIPCASKAFSRWSPCSPPSCATC